MFTLRQYFFDGVTVVDGPAISEISENTEALCIAKVEMLLRVAKNNPPQTTFRYNIIHWSLENEDNVRVWSEISHHTR